MTKEELEQLRKLPNEIRILESELKSIKPAETVDSVTGSSASFPYAKHVVRISGSGINKKRLEHVRFKINNRIEKLLEEVERLNDYIEDIDDSEIRQIMILRYRVGMSWKAIGREMGYAECTVLRKHDAYINLQEKQDLDMII